MSMDKKICDEIHDEYTEENQCIKDEDKKTEECAQTKQPKMHINCNLNVDFDTKNKMIYLQPGKCQYFTVDVSKSCGDVVIKYKGCYPNEGIYGNLGIYRIVQSGVVVETYCKLDPRKRDFLTFTAIDQCTKEYCDFVIAFSSNSCECCYR